MYYLAYGSNLNKEQMRWRCPDAEVVCVSEIRNYRLLFRHGVLTIEPAKGHSVPVVVWKVSDRDIANLDVYEGYPHLYYKRDFMVKFPDGKRHKTFAYLMWKKFPVTVPRDCYLNVCLHGYDDFDLDKEVMNEAVRYTKDLSRMWKAV